MEFRGRKPRCAGLGVMFLMTQVTLFSSASDGKPSDMKCSERWTLEGSLSLKSVMTRPMTSTRMWAHFAAFCNVVMRKKFEYEKELERGGADLADPL